MPAHDWTRVDSGLFHAFHFNWIGAICDLLNTSVLPSDYFALPEQNFKGPIPDALTLELSEHDAEDGPTGRRPVAVALKPPNVKMTQRTEADIYAKRANHVTVRHRHGDVISIIEIESPGNKQSKAGMKALLDKTVNLLSGGIHVLIIDLLPSTKRDPNGIHAVIWEEIGEGDEPYELAGRKSRALASYDAGPPVVAYIEPFQVDDPIPEIPLFLAPESYVTVPLEESYQAAWARFPAPMRKLLE